VKLWVGFVVVGCLQVKKFGGAGWLLRWLWVFQVLVRLAGVVASFEQRHLWGWEGLAGKRSCWEHEIRLN